MELTHTGRDFGIVTKNGERVIQESSAIGDYENSMSLPGSSFLWVGDDSFDREEVAELVEELVEWEGTDEEFREVGNHELDPEEVRDLINHMRTWLKTGKLHPGEGKDE